MVNKAYQRKSVGRVIVTGLMQAALQANITAIQLTRVTADEGSQDSGRNSGLKMVTSCSYL